MALEGKKNEGKKKKKRFVVGGTREECMGSDCGGCFLASGFCWFGGTGALLGSSD